MKEKECNFAMLNQQRMVTLTRNTNGLKNGTHYMGVVKRALKSVGFVIEKLPGPKGKREILRAFK